MGKLHSGGVLMDWDNPDEVHAQLSFWKFPRDVLTVKVESVFVFPPDTMPYITEGGTSSTLGPLCRWVSALAADTNLTQVPHGTCCTLGDIMSMAAGANGETKKL